MSKLRESGILAALLLWLAVLVAARTAEVSSAYQSGYWSEPMFLTDQATSPLVIADSAGDLHLFYVDIIEADEAAAGRGIYYSSRTGGQWLPPVDILFAEGAIAHLNGVVVDDQGYLHLSWSDTEHVYHSTAHVSEAANARNWVTDTVVTGQLPTGEMVQDERGRLHLVTTTDLTSVVYLFSDDSGNSWSPPSIVDRVFDVEEFAIGGSQMTVDPAGNLHLTWTYTAREADWGPWSVWYGRSSDEGNSWQPTEMASPMFGESDIAVDGEGNVHIVYGRVIGLADGRWHRWSDDGGVTWRTERPLYPGVEHASGLTGGYDFAIDGDSRLHLVNSYGDGSGEASAWHLVWLGDRWSAPELLLDKQYHAHFPRLAIAAGNELNFVALAPRHDSSLVYRQGLTDGQSADIRALPTKQIDNLGAGVTDAGQAASVPTSVESRNVLSDEARAAPPREGRFDTLIVGASAATVVLLLGIALSRRFLGGRR